MEQPPPEILDEGQFLAALLEQAEYDPLSSFRCISEAQRKLLRYSSQAEVLMRSGNAGGKTACGAALAVALLRGVRELDGIRLPELPVPCIGWCLVQTYQAQVDSAQAAVLGWLGTWPHKADMLRGDIIQTLWVSTAKCVHETDKRCRTCSKLVFHSADGGGSVGGRIDFGWADEPPKYATWDEFRQRGGAERRLVRFLTATPKEKTWWWWLANRDYGFVNCDDKIVGGLVEIRCSIFDNKALSPVSLADKIASAERSQYKDAILYGDYVDLRGECPFNVSRLQEWQRRPYVVDPETLRVSIRSEQTFDDGRHLIEKVCPVQVWEQPREGFSYLAVLDPSSGVKSKAHDPAAIHVYRWSGRPMLVARYCDYLEPYGLGYLAGKLGTLYNRALIDVDVTGGYGANSITALSQQRYHNIVRDYHEASPGSLTPRLGFVITGVNRSEITTSIVRALEEDSVAIPSADVLSSLLGISVDEKDKWLATPNSARHDEDMICMGRALHLMGTLPTPRTRPAEPAEERFRRRMGWPRKRKPVRRARPLWNPA